MLWLVRREAPIPAALFVRSRALCAVHLRQLWLTVARYEPPFERRLQDANHRRRYHREPPIASRLETPPVGSARRDKDISCDTEQACFPLTYAKTGLFRLRNLLSG